MSSVANLLRIAGWLTFSIAMLAIWKPDRVEQWETKLKTTQQHLEQSSNVTEKSGNFEPSRSTDSPNSEQTSENSKPSKPKLDVR